MKARKIRSVRLRLLFFFVLFAGVIILITDLFIYQAQKTGLIDSIDDSLYSLAEEIEHTILKEVPRTWRQEIKNVRDEFLTNRFFTQILAVYQRGERRIERIVKSEVLAGSDLPVEKKDNILFGLAQTPEFLNVTNRSLSDHPIRIIFFPVILDRGVTYIIMVGTSMKKINQALDKLLWILIISGCFLLVLSSIGGSLVLSGVFKTFKSVVKTARSISMEDLSHRIERKEKDDEIGELVKTFNQMIDRLEHSADQIRQFSSDVAHEIKTPLAIVLGEAEIALRKQRSEAELREVLASIIEESHSIQEIINNLLLLSEMDYERTKFSHEKVSLLEILLGELNLIKSRVQEKKLQVMLSDLNLVHINGNQILLQRMIMNLLDNAVKFTPPGGTIEVTLKEQDSLARLVIRDTGSGIPPDDLPRVFDRFYRVDQARSQAQAKGYGLGLSIVRKILVLHQAEIQLQSTLNEGTRVTVILPLYSDSSGPE